MTTYTIGMRVRITPEAFTHAGEIGIVVSLPAEQKNSWAIVRLDDGDTLGFLIADNEIEEVTE
jgi:hypothetical protein